MAKESAWYNLDNAANIYPAVSNERNTNVYRLSCLLTENIRSAALTQAVEKALESFRYFQMIMRRGLFWYYLESTDLLPEITLESERPCKRIFYKSEKELLFNVSYFGSRINLEVFHAVADGGGAINFLRTIIYHYLLIVHPDTFLSPPKFKMGAPLSDQAEDSFYRHYTPGLKIPSPSERSFILSGTALPSNSVRIITATFSAKEFLAVAKANNATLTAYLTTLMLCAIYEEQVPRRHANKEIAVTVPVDLRTMFSSKSSRNFFDVVEVRHNFKGQAVDFSAVLEAVTKQILEKTTKEYLSESISFNMNMQKNVLARAVPLALKNFILKVAYLINEGTTATTLSNMGRVSMPEEFEPYIESFSCLLNPTPIHKVKLTIITYLDRLELSFTSNIAETRIQRYFIRHLTEQGLKSTLVTNGSDSL